jgi:hypothetical protein
MRLSSKKAAYAVVVESSVVGNPEYARDDKFEGGGPPWQWRRWMDRASIRLSPSISQTVKVSN